MCKCVMSHSWTSLSSFREELHSSCKARSSAQISSQSADLVLSSLHFNSYRCMEAECICDSSLCYPLQEKRKKKDFQTILLSEYNISLHVLLGLCFITQDTHIKRNSWVLCRNPRCCSDSIPSFWCSFHRCNYFTVQTLLLWMWQLLSPLQIFSYIFPSFIAKIFRRRAKLKTMLSSPLLLLAKNVQCFYLFGNELVFFFLSYLLEGILLRNNTH